MTALSLHSIVPVYHKVSKKEICKHSYEKAVKFLITMPRISPNSISIFPGSSLQDYFSIILRDTGDQNHNCVLARIKRGELDQIFWSGRYCFRKVNGMQDIVLATLEK